MAGYNPVGALLDGTLQNMQGFYYGQSTATNVVTNIGTYQGISYNTINSTTYTVTQTYWYPESQAQGLYQQERLYEARAEREMIRAMGEFQQGLAEEPTFGGSSQTQEKVTAAEARERARELLLRFLSPTQRDDYQVHRRFDIHADSGHWYRLHEAHPPQRMDNDRRRAVTSYCIHTRGVPREDELLAFKLMLELNETLFLSTANATPL